jgi:hypothetical protein
MTIPLYLSFTAYALACGLLYARALRIKALYRWFYPKFTWVTVAVGITLGGAPWAWLWLFDIAVTPAFAVILYSTVFLAIGDPIIWEQTRNGNELEAKAKKVRET